jgi:hypothetical protein
MLRIPQGRQTHTDKRPYPLVDTPADKLSVPLWRVLFLPCHVGRAKCLCVRVGLASVASGWLIIFMRRGDEILGMNV